MEFKLTNENQKQIEDAVTHFEEATGAELLVAVTERSADYQAAKMRFAIIATFVMTLVFSNYFHFSHNYYWPVLFIISIIIFLLVARISFVTRLISLESEIEEKTFAKAMNVFFTKGTSQVDHKVTAVIFISALEHKIQVLIDEKLKEKICENDLIQIVDLMKNEFKTDHFSEGITGSIKRFEERVLQEFKGKVSETNPAELCNKVLFI